MTPKQLFQRLQTNLKAMVWGVTANRVFGDDVYIVPEFPIQQISWFRPPAAFIIDTGAVCDPEHPGLMTQAFSITILVENYQHPMGEGVMVGANRVANTSGGAGILDIEDEFLDKFTEITSMTTKILLVEKNSPKVQFVKGNTPLIIRAFPCTAIVSIY